MGSDKILAGKDNFSILECRSMGKKEIKQEKTLLQTSLAHYVERSKLTELVSIVQMQVQAVGE